MKNYRTLIFFSLVIFLFSACGKVKTSIDTRESVATEKNITNIANDTQKTVDNVTESLKSAPCTKENLVGLWTQKDASIYEEILRKNEIEINEAEDLFYAPYQIFQFTNDGYFKQLSSTNEFAEIDKIILSNSPNSSKYEIFNNNGYIKISSNKNNVQVVNCTYILQDDGLLKKNEILLSYIDADEDVFLQRVMQKL